MWWYWWGWIWNVNSSLPCGAIRLITTRSCFWSAWDSLYWEKDCACTITISLYNKVHLSHYGSHNWQVKSRAGRVSNTYVITTDQLKYIGSCQKRIDLCIKTQKFKVVRPCMIKNGRIVSKVTSETFSPSLQTSIDMAYFDNDARQVGSKMRVKARKKEHA